MKYFPFILLIVFFACHSKLENNESTNEASSQADSTEKSMQSEAKYDSTKALELGADEYGMRIYVMAILKKGPNQPKDSAHAKELQEGHVKNINRLAEEDKLILAGPFFGQEDLRGIYIFNTTNIDEAKKFVESDPAIQYGSLEMELKSWYGSAALMEVNKIHKRIAKIEF